MRSPLAGLLLRAGDDAALRALVKRYASDMEPTLLFADVLRRFRRKGDGADSRRALSQAVDSNPFVPDLLLRRVPQPPILPSSYTPGSPDEAALCADYLVEAWESTPGALEWLEKWQPLLPGENSIARGSRAGAEKASRAGRRTPHPGGPGRPRRSGPPVRP